MARRTIIVTISAEGRDKGKAYLITEMPASAAEEWGARAMNTMSKVMGGFSDDLLAAGLPGLTVAMVSAFARANWTDVKPLLDEMFRCIRMVPDPARPEVTRPLVEDDIEEVATRLKLREEVLELHLGFFKDAVGWISTAVRTRLQPPAADDTSSISPTSDPPSAQSSPDA